MLDEGTLTANLRRQAAWFRLLASASRLDRALKYNPNWHLQPRVPAGQPDGGRWTGDGGSTTGTVSEGGVVHLTQVEGGQGYQVDLLEEEVAGGHAVRKHVGRSARSLLETVQKHQYRNWFLSSGLRRDGSFPSLSAANKLVNATLSRNRAIVDMVASGQKEGAFITAVFQSQTGVEAYAYHNIQPHLRDTYGVGVVIYHDPHRSRGFGVLTAYPRND